MKSFTDMEINNKWMYSGSDQRGQTGKGSS